MKDPVRVGEAFGSPLNLKIAGFPDFLFPMKRDFEKNRRLRISANSAIKIADK